MPPSPPKSYPETNMVNALFGIMGTLQVPEVPEKPKTKKDSFQKAAEKSPSKSSHKKSNGQKGSRLQNCLFQRGQLLKIRFHSWPVYNI